MVGVELGSMAMCPYHGFTYVDHGGGPRTSLVVALLLELLPPWFKLHRSHGAVAGVVATAVSTVIAILVVITDVAVVVVAVLAVVGAVATVPARRRKAATRVVVVLRVVCYWSRMTLEQQPGRRCPNGFPLEEHHLKPLGNSGMSSSAELWTQHARSVS
jgi:hypothetical protein